jgi:Prolyl oligopeptidase, N-terminal beta-propeller domain
VRIFLTPRLACVVTMLVAITAAAAALNTNPARAQQSTTEQPDKYTWLEDIHGGRQLAWVRAENERTAAVLEKDIHFAPLEAEALKVRESPDRLPRPEFRNGTVYNTWRDAEHVRGIVRRTTLKDYLTAEPKWETVLDYDALSKADKQSWVGEGLTCLEPENELCLVRSVVARRERQRVWAKLPLWKRCPVPRRFSGSSGGANYSDESFYFYLLSFDSKLRNPVRAKKCQRETYWASPFPYDQFSFGTSTRLMKTSSLRSFTL